MRRPTGKLLEQHLAGEWTTAARTRQSIIHKYSTTGHILSYKRCRRAFGHFTMRGFSSANATQMYFGTLVHDVLDRIHRQYRASGALPKEGEVRDLVQKAHERLRLAGVRAYNPVQQQERATRLIWRFVSLLGPHFFPNVQQTEYRMERSLTTGTGSDYILEGVVDVVTGAVSHSAGMNFSTDPDDIEIWDYKAGRQPGKGSKTIQDYEYQMAVYSELYYRQTGEYPARAVLVFLGELDDDKRWHASSGKPSDYSASLFYILTPTPKKITTAMNDFHQTVDEIEAEIAKPYADQWEAPVTAPDDQTCEACDLRFNCNSYPDGTKLKTTPL